MWHYFEKCFHCPCAGDPLLGVSSAWRVCVLARLSKWVPCRSGLPSDYWGASDWLWNELSENKLLGLPDSELGSFEPRLSNWVLY